MRSTILVSTLGASLAGCGPEDAADESDPPGMLEYESPHARYYRLDRRVEIVALDQEPNIDGEPYVALEPDVPCPE